MIQMNEYWFIEETDDIDNLTCPICGNKLAFQLTGQITSQQLEQDSQYCHLIECVDEDNVQLGYHIFCKEDKHG